LDNLLEVLILSVVLVGMILASRFVVGFLYFAMTRRRMTAQDLIMAHFLETSRLLRVSREKEMFRLGLFSFILSIYQYGLLQSSWIKLIPALSLSLITKDRPTKVSLILAGLGDFFLDLDQVWSFGLGLLLFGCCQVLLILEVSRSTDTGLDVLKNYSRSVGAVLLGGGVSFYFLSYLALPITIYALLLLQLLVLVLPNWSQLRETGCLLFILSDIFVLAELILKQSNQTIVPLRVLPTVGLPIYWMALLLITLSHEPVIESVREVVR
jgi:uncharacterized membrane protein YhhN